MKFCQVSKAFFRPLHVPSFLHGLKNKHYLNANHEGMKNSEDLLFYPALHASSFLHGSKNMHNLHAKH